VERNLSTADAQSIIEVRNFQSKTKIILKGTNLDELWIEMVEQISENISVFQMNGSGWTFHSILCLDIDHRRTRRGVGGWGAHPGLKNFRANSVFKASASCSKILNDKIYFNTVKIFRGNCF